MTLYKTYELGDRVAKIYYDEHPENPREGQDWLGKIYCFHGRYQLGDKHSLSTEDYSGWDAMEKNLKGVVTLPLYLYDHSGLTMRTTSFSDPWDSGQVGLIVAPRTVLKDYGVQIATKKVKEKIKAVLEQEVKTYDAYLRGAVFGWVCDEDSCWGYYGEEEIPYMLECAFGEGHENAEEV